jgi:hypothetical protein
VGLVNNAQQGQRSIIPLLHAHRFVKEIHPGRTTNANVILATLTYREAVNSVSLVLYITHPLSSVSRCAKTIPLGRTINVSATKASITFQAVVSNVLQEHPSTIVNA